LPLSLSSSFPTRRSSDLALGSLVVSLAYRLVAEIPDLVNIGQLDLVLCLSNDLCDLHSFLAVLVPECWACLVEEEAAAYLDRFIDRKSTRLNSSHVAISY